VTRNLLPSGDEKLKIKGEFVLSNLVPAIDPVANGFTFDAVNTQTGQVVLQRFVPAGASPGGSVAGWTVNGSGTRWKFKDKNNTTGTGIQKVVVTDKSARTPGLFKVVVTGKNSNFRVAIEDLRVILTLGGPAQQAANQCAIRTFNNSLGAPPKCELKSGGKTLKCK
jgi:hypothetical protein